jgi:hypothetical protein
MSARLHVGLIGFIAARLSWLDVDFNLNWRPFCRLCR